MKFFCYWDSHFPCFAPIQQYRFNITIKFRGLSLHQNIFILPQRVQFCEDPVWLLDPCYNILECCSVSLHKVTQIRKFSVSTLFTFTCVEIFEFFCSSFVSLQLIFSPAVAASACRVHIFSVYTECLQMNGAVSKVKKKFISHLTRAQRTPLAAATLQVSHALPAVLSLVLTAGLGGQFPRWRRSRKRLYVCSVLRCPDL